MRNIPRLYEICVDADGDLLCDAPACPSTPAAGCLSGPSSSLQIKDDADDDSKDQIKWKLSKADAFDQSMLGDPATTRAYTLCIYMLIIIAALLGSRALYLAEHATHGAEASSRLLGLRQSGLNMYGGVVLAALAVAAYWSNSFAITRTCAHPLDAGCRVVCSRLLHAGTHALTGPQCGTFERRGLIGAVPRRFSMKGVKIVAMAVLAYVAIVAAFESFLGIVQPQNASTIVITTFDDEGIEQDRVVSPLKTGEQLYVAANHWPRSWYKRALRNPNVQVTADGHEKHYLAVPVSGAEHDRVQHEHAHSIWFRILTGFPPRYFLRLDPR
jgi:hypothetical protein